MAADERPRSYFVRTFGCQMNEHDSERIAGLLEADGLTAAADAEHADVVVLNSCCIRAKAPWVDVVFGTHNVHRAADLIELARRDGPIVEVLEAAAADDAAAFPS